MKTPRFDCVILGGGIAGLWLINRLQSRGYQCLLLENHSLGHAQTLHSQGIIHGGLKYALSGQLSGESDAIAEMPAVWRRCIEGDSSAPGFVDLRGIEVLSDTQYMWSGGRLASRFTTFFASKVLRGRIDKVRKGDYPPPLDHPDFSGNVYRLADLVVNTESLLKKLIEGVEDRLRLYQELSFDTADDQITALQVDGQEILADQVILAAGKGNGDLLQQLQQGSSPPPQQMQLRPLQMVSVTSPALPAFYGHCIGTGSKPRITITSHARHNGDTVWYLGGELAENHVNTDPAQLVAIARQELASLFPWLDIHDAHWQTYKIERAEPRQHALVKPDAAYAAKHGNLLVCWPTKLTLAPDLAERVEALLPSPCPDAKPDALPLVTLPRAALATSPWERTEC